MAVSERVENLQKLSSVRQGCNQVYELGQINELEYWTLHESKLEDIVQFCISLIQRDFGHDYDSIPPHGRWRHFNAQGKDRILELLNQWKHERVPLVEVGRRMFDLFIVAVLLDAGAGDEWKFEETDSSQRIGRSEGLAIATLSAFKLGLFSSNPKQKFRVDALSLSKLTEVEVSKMMQSKKGNELMGLAGRTKVLESFGRVLLRNSKYFPPQHEEEDGTTLMARPGNLIDYLLLHPQTIPLPGPVMKGQVSIDVSSLWEAIVKKEGLAGAWPEEGRVKVDGVVIGDVWQCKSLLKQSQSSHDGWISFHKLSQWLTYSLIEVLEKVLEWKVTGKEDLTGLPEYRNGGLLIDFGYLRPKRDAFRPLLRERTDTSIDDDDDATLLAKLIPLSAEQDAVIEWRAVTVTTLDKITRSVNELLDARLDLAQVLEAATWKGGREVAMRLRPSTGCGPPFAVLSDGTVF